MATCIPAIDGNLQFDCDNRDVQGLEVNILLFNRADVDFGNSTIDGANSKLITNFQLLSGKTGYVLQGIKLLNNYLAEVVVNAESLNRWRHNLSARIFNLDKDNRKQIDLIADGANLIAIVERKWKGANNESAFVVLGWGTGMEIQQGQEASNENDGSFVFRVASDDGALEGEGAKLLLEGDYTTTKAAFDLAFAQA